jgi:dUTP pyrophosphatase
MTTQAAGFDLYALEDLDIPPNCTMRVRTGLAFEIPEGHFMLMRDRSSMVMQSPLRVQAGTIDADYRGEVVVVMENKNETTGQVYDVRSKTYHVKAGQRIAQAMILESPQYALNQVESLNTTPRGEKGWGSTGK